jgi:putative Holliday junction resolvase
LSHPILAIDLGSVRIGVAIAERLELPAMPLTTIEHTNAQADVEAIVACARERGARTIVVGNPIKLDGSAGPAAERAGRFAIALQAEFKGEVTLVDERLTTAAASKKLMQGELSGSKRRKLVDRFAAVEILESYLERRRRDA